MEEVEDLLVVAKEVALIVAEAQVLGLWRNQLNPHSKRYGTGE
jgi:hypothetical protein